VAEDVDREQKTEPASARKLNRAYAQGSFPIGRDAVLVATTGAAVVALVSVASSLRNGLVSLFGQAAGSVDRTPFASMAGAAAAPLLAAATVCATAALASALTTLVQTKARIGSERDFFDLERVLRGFSGLGRMFHKDFVFDMLLALGKAFFIALAVYPAIRDDLRRLPELLTAEAGVQLAAACHMLTAAARPAFVALVILAVAELSLTRWRFFREQRMTKQELKDEVKDDEGDPHVKGRVRKRFRELVRNRATIEVPRADALVVNPTHVAVAIRYRRDEGRAPRVTCKGKGALAERMRELARENGVAIVQDIPLARFLYRKVKVGREIPAQTYKAVAAILAFVYRLGKRSAGGTRV
jgi:flagellar biosynthesis protein FlhB